MTTTLVPRVTFAKSDDPEFNHEAAQKAFDLVMKMDLEEARLFCTMVIGDEVHELIEKNQRSFQRRLNVIAKRRADGFAKALADTVVSKRLSDEPFDEEAALAAAGAIALIRKAVDAPSSFWDEHEHRRNQLGQFTFKVKRQTLPKALNDARAQDLGIHRASKNNSSYKGLTPTERAEFQSQYLQIASVLDAFDDNDMGYLLVQPKSGGDRQKHIIQTDKKKVLEASHNKDFKGMLWDPKTENVVGVQVVPSKLTLGGASFDLMQSLGGQGDRSLLRSKQVEAALGDNQNFDRFHDDWLRHDNATDVKNSNSRAYRRVAAGSQFIEQIAPERSQLRIAAKFGSVVGQRGPQAERVIGPAARKTAYRYRGVSKKPDANLKREYEVQRDVNMVNGQRRLNEGTKKEIVLAGDRALANLRGRGESIDMERETRIRNVARSKVVDSTPLNDENQLRYLRQTVADALVLSQGAKKPNPELYNLQLQSGHTPPSEGVIINAKGDMVTQAVGYGDDHYLPFNLRELGALKGGEYVRTRSVGGPTAEDIYAGFIAGAHAMTVTSRSGTFEVVFEDDFKGGRRYNDKAKRMVDRYEKLIDAVQSRQVQSEYGIDRHVVNAIAKDVATQYPHLIAENQRAMVQGRLKAMAEAEDVTEDDERVIDILRDAAVASGDDPGRAEAVARNAVKRAKATTYRLDGQGYEAALQALAEQFPYYIKRVEWHERNQSDEGQSIDRGYVKPKHNRPAQAMAGYFDSTIAGVAREQNGRKTGKFGADEADWQNSGVRDPSMFHRARREELEAADEESKKRKAQQKAAVEGGLVAVPKSEAQKEKKAKQKAALTTAAVALYGNIYSRLNEEDGTKAEYDKTIGTPKQLAKDVEEHGTGGARFKAFGDRLEKNETKWFDPTGGALRDDPEAAKLFTAFKSARGDLMSKEFDGTETQLLTGSEFPINFPEYENLTDQEWNDETAKHNGVSVLGGETYINMADEDLKEEVQKISELKSHLKEMTGKDPAEITDFLTGEGFHAEGDVVQHAIANPQSVAALANSAQRIRALKAVGSKMPKTREVTTQRLVAKEPKDEETVRVHVPSALVQAVNSAFVPEPSDRTRALQRAAQRHRSMGDGAAAVLFENAVSVSQAEDAGIKPGEWAARQMAEMERRLENE